MGVHGLWDILGPTARPVRLEALNKKRLAVDASIWIYQFLKAVRDNEGNQLRNSHIVGFFRRICKILYFGIQPVFVFDGGAPVLKRQTITKRKEKREGNKETAKQTAQKLLAQQLQKLAENSIGGDRTAGVISASPAKQKAVRKEVPLESLEHEEYYEDHNYFDGNQLYQPNGTQLKQDKESEAKKEEKESLMFRRQDEYHLPKIDEFKVDKNDQRMITDYEYDRLTGDVDDALDGIDLDNIDPRSAEFEKLPLETQYIALSHLRLRSRLRMGYTKQQLETLFPKGLDFSKFQIEMVQKRNYLTQRLMNAAGMDTESEATKSRRIASDKDRAYQIQKNENGWTLSILQEGNNGGDANNAIELDKDESDGESEDEFEDVEWEDVGSNTRKPDAKAPLIRSFMDPSLHSEPIFVKDSDDEDDHVEQIERDEAEDATMATIKSLYEYAAHNNKKEKPASLAPENAYNGLTEEEQIQKLEQDELRQAIEKSKKDYLNMIVREEQFSITKDQPLTDNSQDAEPPIILSKKLFEENKDSRAKLNLPMFSFKNSLLGTGRAHTPDTDKTQKAVIFEDQAKEEGTVIIDDPEKGEKPVAQPLPSWFKQKVTPNNHYYSGLGVTTPVVAKEKTEDEKAGLISYKDLDNYIDEDEVNVADLQEVIDLDDDDEEKKPKVANGKVVELSDDDDVEFEDLVTPEDLETLEKPKEVIEFDEIELSEASKGVIDTLIPNNLKTTSATPEIDTAAAKVLVLKENNSTVQELLTGNNKQKSGTEFLDNYEFSDEEDDQLATRLQKEELAYQQFVNEVNHGSTAGSQGAGSFWSMDDETKLQEKLKKQKRDADEVTAQMVLEVQDLLSRFGIPYITAPMEAEAQCAELYEFGLVDGIITDDSDCFLFGGDRIYKNMFNEKNFVECYQVDDIERDLGLNRYKMIELALMLGSDYTEGLKGVGKVSAMEILAEFKNLENFKKWWVDYQNGIIDESQESTIKKKLRKSLNKSALYLTNEFPSKTVSEAYLKPEVDHDKTEFKWGYPNLDKLRTFLMFNVGWNQSKVDEILLPVIKNLNKPQSTIEEFFPVEMIRRRRDIMMGKRLKNATNRLKRVNDGGSTNDEVVENDGVEENTGKKAKKPRTNKKQKK